MKTFSFIELIVKKPLEKSVAFLWRDTVLTNGPKGIIGSQTLETDIGKRVSNFYRETKNNKVYYVIPLTRDLEDSEVEDIVYAWDASWPNEEGGDFIINASSRSQQIIKIKELQENKLFEIAQLAAKKSHQKWYQEMTDKGWGYGIRFNEKSHQHPMMLSWDRLNDQYQKNKIKTFLDLLKVLEEMNLKIIQR